MEIDKVKLLQEVKYKTSRSGGAGGQHVNKTETRVELIFKVEESEVLTDEQKKMILSKSGSKINAEGELRVYASDSRSQAKNKEEAGKKFIELIAKALRKKAKRIPTTIPEEIKEKIKLNKKRQSEKKKSRRVDKGDF